MDTILFASAQKSMERWRSRPRTLNIPSGGLIIHSLENGLGYNGRRSLLLREVRDGRTLAAKRDEGSGFRLSREFARS